MMPIRNQDRCRQTPFGQDMSARTCRFCPSLEVTVLSCCDTNTSNNDTAGTNGDVTDLNERVSARFKGVFENIVSQNDFCYGGLAT
jgi:hypothetical protein